MKFLVITQVPPRSPFALGEILVSEDGREIGGRRRSPSTWAGVLGVESQEFSEVEDAILKAKEVAR